MLLLAQSTPSSMLANGARETLGSFQRTTLTFASQASPTPGVVIG